MAYVDQYDFATTGDFLKRVQVAMAVSSRSVFTGPKDPSDNVYGKRTALALRILHTPNVELDAFRWALAADATVTAATTDAQLQTKVDAIFSAIAGVKAGD